MVVRIGGGDRVGRRGRRKKEREGRRKRRRGRLNGKGRERSKYIKTNIINMSIKNVPLTIVPRNKSRTRIAMW